MTRISREISSSISRRAVRHQINKCAFGVHSAGIHAATTNFRIQIDLMIIGKFRKGRKLSGISLHLTELSERFKCHYRNRVLIVISRMQHAQRQNSRFSFDKTIPPAGIADEPFYTFDSETHFQFSIFGAYGNLRKRSALPMSVGHRAVSRVVRPRGEKKKTLTLFPLRSISQEIKRNLTDTHCFTGTGNASRTRTQQ